MTDEEILNIPIGTKIHRIWAESIYIDEVFTTVETPFKNKGGIYVYTNKNWRCLRDYYSDNPITLTIQPTSIKLKIKQL